MRTPRPLLGIFALALLLPLLLLACGGSDEPTGGRSSERATDEPESRTSSGRTTLAPTSPETDREALVGFYNATGGPNWNDNNNWLSDVPISEWEGVATDGNGRVTELYLEGNQLSGEIPPELGNLAKLKDLDLWRNQLRGEIPLELGSFANLKRLDLGENQLSGEIPPELGNLANLTHLHLAVNQLSGEIPPELGNFANLKRLDLGENRLSGRYRRSWATSPTCHCCSSRGTG